MLRRLNQRISIDLDNRSLDSAKRIKMYRLKTLIFTVKEDEHLLTISRYGQELKSFELGWLKMKPSTLFHEICDLLLDE
jgi:hypothetical protein